MKRLALLLAAMGIISVGATAAELKVTNVGQEIEIENENGAQTFDNVWLWNNVGLSYGDWTFGLQAGKNWSVDFDGQSTHGKDERLQIDVWKKVNDNLKLGYRFRGQDNFDRHYARWSYKNGMFYTDGDVWYEATNRKEGGTYDWMKSEIFPVGLNFGDFKVAYFLNYNWLVGTEDAGKQTSEIDHQIRAYWDFYKTEKLTLSTEARLSIYHDQDWKDESNGKETGYRHFDGFGRLRVYLKANYKVTESLDIYGSYAYGWRDYKYENGDSRENYGDYKGAKAAAKENYQDIIVGWKYTF